MQTLSRAMTMPGRAKYLAHVHSNGGSGQPGATAHAIGDVGLMLETQDILRASDIERPRGADRVQVDISDLEARPPLLLGELIEVTRGVFGEMFDAGYACRVDLPPKGPAAHLSGLTFHENGELWALLVKLRSTAHAAGGEMVFPVVAWWYPGAHEHDALAALDELGQDPADEKRFRTLMQLGVIEMTVAESAIDIVCQSDKVVRMEALVRQVVSATGVGATT